MTDRLHPKPLFRYTNLASALDVLGNLRLTLLNPASWEDRGDAYYVDNYAKACGYKSVQSLCFSASGPTFQHWKTFTGGTDGVCIKFHRQNIEKLVQATPSARIDSIQYLKIGEPKQIKDKERIPFIKRVAYENEDEVRILFSSKTRRVNNVQIPIKQCDILKVTLSPWLPIALFDGLKNAIANSTGYPLDNIVRSTMIDGAKWRSDIGHLIRK